MSREQDLEKMFFEESLEHIAELERNLIKLEREGKKAGRDLVNAVFRSFHSLKGASMYYSFSAMTSLCHAAENILDKVRSGETQAGETIISFLLTALDCLKIMFAQKKFGDDNITAAALAKLVNALAPEGAQAAQSPAAVVHFSNSLGDTVFSVSEKKLKNLFAKLKGAGVCAYVELDLRKYSGSKTLLSKLKALSMWYESRAMPRAPSGADFCAVSCGPASLEYLDALCAVDGAAIRVLLPSGRTVEIK